MNNEYLLYVQCCLGFRVYFLLKEIITNFYMYSIFPVETWVCGCLYFTACCFKLTSHFRIVVLQNYFFVLHPLSAPLEITVLPLKVVGAKWEIIVQLMEYSKIS